MAQQAYPATSRLVTDAVLVTNSTLAANSAVANTANGSMIDLGAVTIHPTNEEIDVKVSVPAMPTMVNTIATQTIAIIDGTENVGANGTAVPALASIVVTGVDTTGPNATSVTFKLPGTTRRYLGLRVTGSANTQNQMALSATMTVLF